MVMLFGWFSGVYCFCECLCLDFFVGVMIKEGEFIFVVLVYLIKGVVVNFIISVCIGCFFLYEVLFIKFVCEKGVFDRCV